MAKRRAHDGRSTVASLFRNGSSIERLRYLVSHSNCRFQVRAKPRCATSCAPFVRTSPPATRSSSREAGSSAAFTEPSSASERCSTGSSSPSMHYLRGKMTAAGKLLISRRPRQCSTPRGRTVARTCPEKATRSWWQAGFVLLRLIALSEGHPRWKQQPLLACSSWIFESSRRHGARTPPGSVVPRCVHHASARWGAEPSRTRSNPAHGALDPSKDCEKA